MSHAELEHDLRMMELALQLAEQSRPSPNPQVGAVVEKQGQVLATGFHERPGGPHAEIVALRELGGRADGATLYVTLEPCDHVGRTGPCSRALLSTGLKRVVIGCEDPVPLHAGGAKRLRDHGIDVRIGVHRERAERLIEDFAKHVVTGLPYVTVRHERVRRRAAPASAAELACHASRRAAPSTRHGDAVMVDVGTVLQDDLDLEFSGPGGRPLARVVLDSELCMAESARLFEHPAPVWVFHAPDASTERARALRARGADLVAVPRDEAGLRLSAVLSELGQRDVVCVLVWGGRALQCALRDAELIDDTWAED